MGDSPTSVLPESDCDSNLKEEDDDNSRMVIVHTLNLLLFFLRAKHVFNRATDISPKDIDPPLINYGSPLPTDVTTNILSRINGRALLKLLPVCKEWWSLTKDAAFIDLHLSLAVKLIPPGIILFSYEENKGQKKCKFQVFNHLLKPQFSLERESDPALVTPACNGLICIYDFKSSITICNPTTQKFMDLPRATPNSARLTNVYPKCSLGFDPIRKKYRVVRFFYRKVDHVNQNYNLGYEIFTLGAVWWKSIGSIGCYPTGPGVNAKGSIYWMIGDGAKDTLTDKIIALNLTNAKFRDVSLSATRSQLRDDKESISLAQLEENLCVVYTRFFYSSTVDIWMLKDYLGKKWMHKCHITLPAWMGDLRSKIEPISMYGGKVLLRWGWSLYEYDLRIGIITQKYTLPCNGHPLKAFSFVQSLVSLGNSS
ncbi:F-box and associated interaction domains-containing protein [Rhynchospora pubera]|uniref:F-box and associated interaction domains-containing protein n=1 Tax=Rhynchospora pubera TaxID=906938 RepID=A0AAV8G6D3_9POAL|nr:F-box and associated interaction domains-containing protein [Rhynchospora pubera]